MSTAADGVTAIAGLRRHQLLRLSAIGWSCVLGGGAWGGDARDCLAHWVANDLPLVVARQRLPSDGTSLDLGLPAPARWGRQRLGVRVDRGDLRASAVRFPPTHAIAPLLPPAARAGWCALADAIAALGVAARVVGSFGWQRLTGLACVRDGSDVDLLMPVDDAAVADAVAALLVRAERAGASAMPRLDGEFEWPDGSAVAWREWREWRAGRGARTVLVKRIDGLTLESDTGWLNAVDPAAGVPRPMACTH